LHRALYLWLYRGLYRGCGTDWSQAYPRDPGSLFALNYW
jgi:hypothetical protein